MRMEFSISLMRMAWVISIGIMVYTDEEGRMIFKPQGKGAKKDV